MARITVEDCIDKFPSRFELVLVASNRARKLHSGEDPTVEKDNDKNTVIALREIAQETMTVDQLKNDLVEEYQTTSFSEDEEINENDENLLTDNNSSIENEISHEEVSDNENIEEDSVNELSNIDETQSESLVKDEAKTEDYTDLSNEDIDKNSQQD